MSLSVLTRRRAARCSAGAQRVEEVHGCSELLGPAELLALTLPQRLAYVARSLLSHANWYTLDLPGLL